MTCLMVTHNPDLECYADRILYVADGTFESQVCNGAERSNLMCFVGVYTRSFWLGGSS